MAKYVLTASEDTFDFSLFGLRFNDNQYRIVNHLNTLFRIDLTLSDYLQLHLKNGKAFQFSLFQYIDEELGLEYNLIPNKSNLQEPTFGQSRSNLDLFNEVDVDESTLIIPELPQIDFFLMLKGEGLFQYEDSLLNILKTSTELLSVKEIYADDLPSKRNLIL